MSIADLFFKRTAVDFLENAVERGEMLGYDKVFEDGFDPSSKEHQTFVLSHFLENLGGGDPDAGLDLFKQLELSPDVSIIGHGAGVAGQVYILSDNSVVKVVPAKEEKAIRDLDEMSLTGMPEIYNIVDIPSSETAHQEKLRVKPHGTPIKNPDRVDVAIHMENAGKTLKSFTEKKKELWESTATFIDAFRNKDKYFENFSGPEDWIERNGFELSEGDMDLFGQFWKNWALWRSLGLNVAEDRHWENIMIDEETNQIYFIDFGDTSTKQFHKEQEGLGRIMDAPATIGDALKSLTGDLPEGEESEEGYQFDDEKLFNYVYSKLNEAFNFAYGPTQLTTQTNRFLKEYKDSLSPEFIDSKLAEFESRFQDVHPMPSADKAWMNRPREEEPVEEEMPSFFPGMPSD